MKTVNCLNIINRVPEGTHTYYDKRHHIFVTRSSDNYESRNIILAPCSYYMKSQIWREFYLLLTEEQYELAKSYPYRKGVFDYLKEIGLYEIYRQAEENVEIKELTAWLIKNDIDLVYALQNS